MIKSPIVSSGCTDTSGIQSIKLLSPNGGEVYRLGQKVTINWKSCNMPKGAVTRLLLARNLPNNSQDVSVILESTSLYDLNIGSYVWQIPSTTTPASNYFISIVCGNPDLTSNCSTGTGNNTYAITDDTDGLFTINSTTHTVSSCTDSDGGIDVNVFGLTDGRVNGIGSYFSDQSVAKNGGVCSGDDCTGVAEGYCKDDKVTNYVIQCPSGKSKEGVCIKQTLNTSDSDMPIDVSKDKKTFTRTLRVGSKGDDVKSLQLLLKIKADGVYGRGTATKVKEWQVSRGLKPDGSFGPASRLKINTDN